MEYGFHIVMGMYGFWLPNDPRGSWSDFVGAWELLRFGKTSRQLDRSARITAREHWLRQEAKQNLKYPPVVLTGQQALMIGQGFAAFCRRSQLTIWACSILPEHIHLVLAQYRYSPKQVANLLKGAGTRELRANLADPMQVYGADRSPWARGEWRAPLWSQASVENAIQFVEANPRKEGKPRQHWSFVSPYRGIDECCVYF